MTTVADQLLSHILTWASAEQPIRALVLVGSRTHHVTTDDLADIDVQLYTTTSDPYVHDHAWLSTIGKVWLAIPTHYDHGAVRIPTRLVIFAGGVKVDFALYPTKLITDVLGTGHPYRVLLDKDHLTETIQPRLFTGFRPPQPTQDEFEHVVAEFYFEAYHVAKYLRREDLWLVKFRDWATKQLLLTLIEWNEQAKHQWQYDTQYMGKHMRTWVSASTWTALHTTFAHFNTEDSWAALLATIRLFRQIAMETAALLDFVYPHEVDQQVSGFINQLAAA